jgi:hypothetical protein
MHGVRSGGASLLATPPRIASSPVPTCETGRDCSASPAEESGITLRASMSVCNGPLPILSSKGARAPTCLSG